MALFNVYDLRKEAREKYGNLAEAKSKEAILTKAVRSLNDEFDIFMSHRSLDAPVVDMLGERIERLGYSVYSDTIVDHELDRSRVSKETAELLRIRMQHCKCLLFAVTTNSGSSVWMPWEPGYFDGHKNGRVAILPVSEAVTPEYTFSGQEYLGLYHYIDIVTSTSGQMSLWVNETPSKYIDLNSWLNGKETAMQV